MTIPRNHTNKIKEIFAKAKNGRVYTLDNNFSGESVSIKKIKDELFGFNASKLEKVTENEYTVRIHSNCWYRFNV